MELLVRAVGGRRRCRRWVNNSGSKELGGLPKIINTQDPRVQCIFLFTCTLLPPTVHSWVLTDVDKFGKGKDQRKAAWKEGQREQVWCGVCVPALRKLRQENDLRPSTEYYPGQHSKTPWRKREKETKATGMLGASGCLVWGFKSIIPCWDDSSLNILKVHSPGNNRGGGGSEGRD